MELTILHVYKHICTYVWGLEVNFRCHFSGSTHLGYFLGQSLIDLKVANSPGLAGEAQKAACLCIPRAGITNVCTVPAFLKVGSRHHTQVLTRSSSLQGTELLPQSVISI